LFQNLLGEGGKSPQVLKRPIRPQAVSDKSRPFGQQRPIQHGSPTC
jgi:hypothetical protein